MIQSKQIDSIYRSRLILADSESQDDAASVLLAEADNYLNLCHQEQQLSELN